MAVLEAKEHVHESPRTIALTVVAISGSLSPSQGHIDGSGTRIPKEVKRVSFHGQLQDSGSQGDHQGRDVPQ